MPASMQRCDNSDSDWKDESSGIIITTTKKNSKHKEKSTKHNVSTIPTLDTFSNEESEDDDILNEKVSDRSKMEAMEKAIKILSKCKTNSHRITNPQ